MAENRVCSVKLITLETFNSRSTETMLEPKKNSDFRGKLAWKKRHRYISGKQNIRKNCFFKERYQTRAKTPKGLSFSGIPK